LFSIDSTVVVPCRISTTSVALLNISAPAPPT
jgi:hypothetical protein